MATAAAIKARKGMEQELHDLQTQFEVQSKSKQEVGVVNIYVYVSLLHCYCGCDIASLLLRRGVQLDIQ